MAEKDSLVRGRRRSIRLKGFDYAQDGAYFVSICTRERECLFGQIADGAMVLDRPGQMVSTAWYDLPEHYPYVELDAFVIMPNHVHGIIVLAYPTVRAGLKPAPTSTRRHALPEIVRAFKTFSSKRVNTWRGTAGVPLWQRNYYERVIRNEDDLRLTRQYILDNPGGWAEDENHPERMKQSITNNLKGLGYG